MQTATRLWLFLDYDGTLVDFAPTPDEIRPNQHVISLLNQLAHLNTLRLTVISGRKIGDIQRLLPIDGIFLGGTYGVELLTPSGEFIERAQYDLVRPLLELVKSQWEELIADRSGFFLEDKGWSLALHARFAEAKAADQVIISARQLLEEEFPPSRYRILGGDRFLEIAPAEANKGSAVDYLLGRYPWPDARLIYIGDDDKDEEAFDVIHGQNGVAIKVGPTLSPRADLMLASPQIVQSWLHKLLT